MPKSQGIGGFTVDLANLSAGDVLRWNADTATWESAALAFPLDIQSGGWDADTNTPDLSVLTPANGEAWVVLVAGATTLGGITPWALGDVAVSLGGGLWAKVPASAPVVSVNGELGAVILDAADVGADATGTAAAQRAAHEALLAPHPSLEQVVRFSRFTTGVDGWTDQSLGQPGTAAMVGGKLALTMTTYPHTATPLFVVNASPLLLKFSPFQRVVVMARARLDPTQGVPADLSENVVGVGFYDGTTYKLATGLQGIGDGAGDVDVIALVAVMGGVLSSIALGKLSTLGELRIGCALELQENNKFSLIGYVEIDGVVQEFGRHVDLSLATYDFNTAIVPFSFSDGSIETTGHTHTIDDIVILTTPLGWLGAYTPTTPADWASAPNVPNDVFDGLDWLADPVAMFARLDAASAESETESSTSAGVAQDKTTLAYTPIATGSYVLFYAAEISGSVALQNFTALVTEAGLGTLAEHNGAARLVGDYHTVGGSKVLSLTASTAYTFKIKWFRNGAAGNAMIRRARLVIMRIA